MFSTKTTFVQENNFQAENLSFGQLHSSRRIFGNFAVHLRQRVKHRLLGEGDTGVLVYRISFEEKPFTR